MSHYPNQQHKAQSINLKTGVVFGFSSAQPLDLICQRGCVWVTQNGVDLVLNAGEQVRLSAKDRVVVEALQGDACISWEEADATLVSSAKLEKVNCAGCDLLIPVSLG